MKDILRDYTELFQRQRKNLKRYTAMLLVLALTTTLFVNWQLHGVGISMTAEYQCGMEEHEHTAACYEKVLTCGYTEGEPEDWNATPLPEDWNLDPGFGMDAEVSDEPEYEEQIVTEMVEEPHVHTDECYEERQVLDCLEEEHVHGDDCFDPETSELICDKFEHTHDESCYTTERELVCGLEEGELVETPVETVVLVPVEKAAPAAVQTYEAPQAKPVATTPTHVHTDACYTEYLVCTKPEHHHTVECLSDPMEDVESEADWLAKTDTTLTGEWGKDLVTVAKSQLGYEESIKNFRLDTDDGETVRGYSRYGAWYGNKYGEWDVMFLSYCLHYADVPSSVIPQRAGVLALRSDLRGSDLLVEADGMAAMPGDIVIYNNVVTETVAKDETYDDLYSDSTADVDADPDDPYGIALYSAYQPRPVVVDDSDLVQVGKTGTVETETRDVSIETVGIVTEVNADAGTLTVISGDVNGKVAEVQVNASDVTDVVLVNAAYYAYQADADKVAVMPSPSGDAHDLENVATSLTFKLYKKVGDDWELVEGNVTDGDEIKIEIDYEMPHDKVSQDQNSITYQLPEGIDIEKFLQGFVSGTVGSVTKDGTSAADSWGSYTIEENGKVTITFNEEFLKTNDKFSGKLNITGKVSLNGSENEKKFTFKSDDKEYTILPKEEPADLKIEKTGVKNEDGTISYTITASSENGTKDKVKLNDTMTWSGLKDYSMTEPVVKKGETTVPAADYTYTPKADAGGFELELPALGKGESYTVTYTVKYGDVDSKDGAAFVNNNLIGYDGDTWRGQKDVRTDIQKTVIAKSGNATDNNSMVEWIIKVNPDRQNGVAGEWTIADKLNGTETIDWSKVDIVKIQKSDNGWAWEDASADFDKATGKLNVKDGYEYQIVYKTPVDFNGSNSVTETNHVDMDDGNGKHYEGDASTGVNKSDLFKEKKAAGQTVTEPGKTVQQSWTITLNPEKDSSGTLTITDVMYDQSHKVDSAVHWTTKALLEEAFGKLGVTYELKCYSDADGTVEVTSDTEKVVRFQLKLIPADKWDGSAVNITYKSLFSIENLAEGDTQKVTNAATVGGVTHEADASYTNKKRLNKYVEAKDQNGTDGWRAGTWNVDYNAAEQGLKYRIVFTPDTTGEQVIKDTLPNGLIVDENDVSVKFIYIPGGHCYEEESGCNLTVEGHKPTVKVDGQDMTITIPSGFPEKITGDDFGFAIEYTAKLTDSFWDDFNNVSNSYSNTVIWGARQETQTTVVERTTSTLIKDGKQETDANGNLINKIKYWVVINAAGKKLNGGKQLTLTDTIRTNEGVSISLDTANTKLYGFDPLNKDDHYKGTELANAAFQFNFDEATKTFTVTVPDETPCVLEYVYTVENWNNKTQATLNNSAQLEGEGTESTTSSVKIKEADSGASVSKSNVLTLIKVDEDRYQVHLKGAQFDIQKYENGSWTSVEQDVETDDAGTYQVRLSGYTRNVLYKAVETKAPDGYKLRDTPYYFVPLESNWTEENWWNANQRNLPSDVRRDDIIFVEYNGFANVYIPNKSTSLKVQKLWVDSNGNPTTGQDIRVQLYQNTQKLEACNVTVRFAGSDYTKNYSEATYQVKPGTEFTVKVKWGSSVDLKVDGKTHTISPMWDSNLGSQVCTFPVDGAVMSDTLVLINAGWDGMPQAENYLACTFTPAEWVTADSTPYGGPVTLTAGGENAYTYTWRDLPDKVNETPVYYTVQEVDAPDGYTVTYLNNNGIQTGVIVITNKETPPPPGDDGFELPSTGGTGTTPFTAVGGAMALAALVCGACRKRRRERRTD